MSHVSFVVVDIVSRHTSHFPIMNASTWALHHNHCFVKCPKKTPRCSAFTDKWLPVLSRHERKSLVTDSECRIGYMYKLFICRCPLQVLIRDEWVILKQHALCSWLVRQGKLNLLLQRSTNIHGDRQRKLDYAYNVWNERSLWRSIMWYIIDQIQLPVSMTHHHPLIHGQNPEIPASIIPDWPYTTPTWITIFKTGDTSIDWKLCKRGISKGPLNKMFCDFTAVLPKC